MFIFEGPAGSMRSVFGLSNNSYKASTNTAWVRAGFGNYKLEAQGAEPVSLSCHSVLPKRNTEPSIRASHQNANRLAMQFEENFF